MDKKIMDNKYYTAYYAFFRLFTGCIHCALSVMFNIYYIRYVMWNHSTAKSQWVGALLMMQLHWRAGLAHSSFSVFKRQWCSSCTKVQYRQWQLALTHTIHLLFRSVLFIIISINHYNYLLPACLSCTPLPSNNAKWVLEFSSNSTFISWLFKK